MMMKLIKYTPKQKQQPLSWFINSLWRQREILRILVQGADWLTIRAVGCPINVLHQWKAVAKSRRRWTRVWRWNKHVRSWCSRGSTPHQTRGGVFQGGQRPADTCLVIGAPAAPGWIVSSRRDLHSGILMCNIIAILRWISWISWSHWAINNNKSEFAIRSQA